MSDYDLRGAGMLSTRPGNAGSRFCGLMHERNPITGDASHLGVTQRTKILMSDEPFKLPSRAHRDIISHVPLNVLNHREDLFGATIADRSLGAKQLR